MASAPKKHSLVTAITVTISTMIGTGVFTSLGFQVFDIKSVPPLLALWIIGGIIATAGALTYGELTSAFPRSGGEYNFLSRLYHPIVGFLSGYVSATVAFAAPIALAGMALGTYFGGVISDKNAPDFESVKLMIALGAVLLMTMIHIIKVSISGNFQKYITSLVVLLIVALIMTAFIFGNPTQLPFLGFDYDFNALLSAPFAVSLIYVSYSYSGWNGAAYITEEVENPTRNVPLALFIGTMIVMGLYVLLNFSFLYMVPVDQLQGQIDVGLLAAKHIFGDYGAVIVGLLISVCLLSAVSGMTFIGPRVTQTMMKDVIPNIYNRFKFLSKEVPVVPIIFQSLVAVFMIVTYTFEQVLVYIGFTLSLSTTATVFGIFILRTKLKHIPRTYKTFGYPFTPILFILFEIWMLTHILMDKPEESLAGLATVLSGIAVYYIAKHFNTKFENQ
ncbi:MAG: amino acid permease [Bacteroidetes bacterium]|nr:amino acid permease [Bacteroidota bacterium]